MPAELTKKAIMASFLKLINERTIDKIAVKDIVLDCGINRNTFYYHYEDIYAVARDIFEREATHVTEQYRPQDNWEDAFVCAAQFALDNKRAIFHIYNSSAKDMVVQYLNTMSQDLMTHFVREHTRGLTLEERDVNLLALFYRHAIVGIIEEWLIRGMKDDPKAVIHRLAIMLDGSIRQSLQRVAVGTREPSEAAQA